MNTKKSTKALFSILMGAITLTVGGCGKDKEKVEEGAAAPQEKGIKGEKAAPKVDGLERPEVRRASPADGLENLGWAVKFESPEQLATRFSKVLKQIKTVEDLEKLLPPSAMAGLSSVQRQQVQKFLDEAKGADIEIAQIGELEHGKRSRWAVNVPGAGALVLDVIRENDGKWSIDKILVQADAESALGEAGQGGEPGKNRIVLPDADVDGLNFTHTFLQHLLRQDFRQAKAMTAAGKVSDAQLAGLCILFEEAAYHLRKEKPLREVFSRDVSAGFYAHVESDTGQAAGQFSVILQRAKVGDAWHVHELNLDELLQDFAKRVAGGDVYYTPLVKNPKGGDTLAIFFDFASNELALRTRKQLDVVANLLKVDPSKTVNLTGHTDSVGTKDFNKGLSKTRALAVKEYLISQGVGAEQIITKGFGDNRPRLPNTLDDGTDNPTGRRANRRTEIYLDF